MRVTQDHGAREQFSIVATILVGDVIENLHADLLSGSEFHLVKAALRVAAERLSGGRSAQSIEMATADLRRAAETYVSTCQRS